MAVSLPGPRGLFLGLLSRSTAEGRRLVFIVLKPAVGWRQNAGKTGMALLLRNERCILPLEIVRPDFKAVMGLIQLLCLWVSSSLIPAL